MSDKPVRGAECGRICRPSLVGDLELSDTAWFEAVFRAHYAKLAIFAFRYVRSREAAEDIVQDLLLAVWSDRERWRGGGPTPGWGGTSRAVGPRSIGRTPMAPR